MFLVSILVSWNHQKLLLEIAMLVSSHPSEILANKLVKKLVWTKHKLQNKLQLQLKNTWAKNRGPMSHIDPTFSSFASFLNSGQSSTLLCFCTNFNWYFLDDGGWTNSCAKHEIIAFWVGSLMPPESSNLELCRLINNQNTLNWSKLYFSFWQ